MLSRDSLFAQANERGMPVGKMRGLVREYMQVLFLKALYGQKTGRGLIFLGGTALRLVYNTRRFSEDLDFDAETTVSFPGWKQLLETSMHEFSRHGVFIDLPGRVDRTGAVWQESRHLSQSGIGPVELHAGEKGRLLTGDIRIRGVLQTYGISSIRDEKLTIKVEANRPRYPIAAVPRVVSGFGEMFPVAFADPGLLFSEKMLALLNREMGRDVYDLFFIAGQKWKPDPCVLKLAGVHGNPAAAIRGRLSGWGSRKLAGMARRLEPFLFEPEQAKMVDQADRLLPPMLEYLASDY